MIPGKTVQHLSVMIFRGISGFLLKQAGFVPGKSKKGGKHRKGALTDDMGSALVSLKKAPPVGGAFMPYYRDAFAFSHSAVKAAGSWIAVSDSILRFMSIPASFRPCMKVE